MIDLIEQRRRELTGVCCFAPVESGSTVLAFADLIHRLQHVVHDVVTIKDDLNCKSERQTIGCRLA